MSDKSGFWDTVIGLAANSVDDVLSAASAMEGTIIAAAAFGGFCLFLYRVINYYNDFNIDIVSKEHALAFMLILFALIFLPLFGVAFVGLYGITNHIAAWQIGLTTPMIIESALIAYAKKAASGRYHEAFTPIDDAA